MWIELFILFLDLWGYHWTDYGRCNYPSTEWVCEIPKEELEFLDYLLTEK